MDDITVEVAMQYTTGYHETVMSFANNIHTHEGGTHEQGFRTALTRVINDYAKKNKLLKENEDNLTGDKPRPNLEIQKLLRLPIDSLVMPFLISFWKIRKLLRKSSKKGF